MQSPEDDKPMSKWSLSELLAGLHDDIQNRLAIARKTMGHPTTKGDASEEVWLEMLRKYLPQRYQAAKAHVVDSRGAFSEQIDVVVFDRQYSPFIFNFQNQTIIPTESVYAAFEAKQTINADQIEYAQKKSGKCPSPSPHEPTDSSRGRNLPCENTRPHPWGIADF